MKHTTPPRILPAFAAAALSCLALGSCTSPSGGGAGETPGDGPGAPPGSFVHVGAPWTRDFLEPAILVAEEIRIEGPTGLREHLVVRQDNLNTTYFAKTTNQGLLQETQARPERGYVEIHGQLDALVMVAFKRIVWLEKPGDGPVLIRALGDASWERTDGSDSRQGPEIELRGDGPR